MVFPLFVLSEKVKIAAFPAAAQGPGPGRRSPSGTPESSAAVLSFALKNQRAKDAEGNAETKAHADARHAAQHLHKNDAP